MNWITDYEVLDNTLLAWITAAGITVLALAVFMVVKWVLINRLGALSKHAVHDVFASVVHSLRGTRMWLLFFPALNFGVQALELPPRAYDIAGKLAAVALFVQIGLWGMRQISFWIDRSKAKAQDTNIGAATSLGAVSFIGQVVLWSILLLVILQNMGVDITALIAGLGVGGIAVALAVQNILGDLFASLSIVIDKPFVIGDFVVVGEYAGTVEYVGLKTTRLRSLSGEQLIFSNSDMLSTRVRNYKRMETRRIVFGFGVLYSTPHAKLAGIPQTVREIVEAQERAKFDRAHFKAFGESSYDFEVVYIMQVPDFNAYMDVQQEINLELVRRFGEQGIDFAFPTRTLDFPGVVNIRTLRDDDGDAETDAAAQAQGRP
ncbi:mechanosensitive ion channel family protein [Coralloluteibacterium stylophorae]|uniref:Mechanosensitive ion channel family protein n=1 Tax=Coralloluteibacterium stylophorae TaxID=1776034 RepID=A0A8J8AYD0_9GAMM|nr:mechanosensitive ion channel family protein [Coralloluteibacterium stylophorae]MBS7457951.1 mechanosensitive ion channel family protein [Coralloluteibacterium stylophorae]